MNFVSFSAGEAQTVYPASYAYSLHFAPILLGGVVEDGVGGVVWCGVG